MPPENELDDKQVFESFVRQASIALAHRQTEDRLRRNERRFEDTMNLFSSPAALIGSDGRYAFVNDKFAGLFGYTLQDIPHGTAWFSLAFPDPEYRKEAIEVWRSDLERAIQGQIASRTFEVRCKNGESKTIRMQPARLSDGMQLVTYEDLSCIDRKAP
jgi:PAS domain S-box-containing protein